MFGNGSLAHIFGRVFQQAIQVEVAYFLQFFIQFVHAGKKTTLGMVENSGIPSDGNAYEYEDK